MAELYAFPAEKHDPAAPERSELREGGARGLLSEAAAGQKSRTSRFLGGPSVRCGRGGGPDRTHAPLPPLRLGAPTFPGAFGDGSADADTTAARSGQKQGLADGGRDHRGSPVFPWTRQNLIPGFRWDPGRTSVPRFVRAILPVRNRPPSMVQTGWPPWVCLSSLPRRNSAAIACACKRLGARSIVLSHSPGQFGASRRAGPPSAPR